MPVFPLLVEMSIMAKQEEEEVEDRQGSWHGRRTMPGWAYVLVEGYGSRGTRLWVLC